ncbi:MAG: UDP-glucosyltransferase [Nitrospinae bacterium]|nr:UDP-glucosyltransferase [Nitrospinota bacterium]
MIRPRILCYAVDGLGLGHLTRVLAIARQLRSLAPNAEIIFLTSNEAAAFCLREGFAAFKVPSHAARETGRLRPSLHAKLVQSVTWSLVASFDPHLLLVDSFPAGALQEILPLLRWSMARVFIYRERQKDTAADPYFQNLLTHYHLAIIPHQPGELDLPLPEGLGACAVGPILLRDRGDALPRDVARRSLVGEDDGRQLCYVNFGGGGDKAAREALATTLSVLAHHPDIRPVVAPGPLGEEIVVIPSGGLVARIYPIAPYFTGIDFAISAAGYNSHAELLHFGVPTAFLPFDKGIDDQLARVARTVAAGAGLAVRSLASDELKAALAQLRDSACQRGLSESGQRLVSTNGARLAAQKVLELLR